MRDAAVMLPPSSGIIAATALQPRDAHLLGCFPPKTRRGETTAPPPFWPRFRPTVWGVPSRPIAVDPGRLPSESATGLLKSRQLSYR
jgi:hypothetical protein